MAAKDGSLGSVFLDAAIVSVAFPANTDGSVSLNDVAMHDSRSLAQLTQKLALL
jgi:hypothetical protein